MHIVSLVNSLDVSCDIPVTDSTTYLLYPSLNVLQLQT